MGKDYRLWNCKPPVATQRQLDSLNKNLGPPRRVFRKEKVAVPRKKRSEYSDNFLITLVAMRFGSLRTFTNI